MIRKLVNSMFSGSEVGEALSLVLETKWIVDNSSATLSIDAETNQNSHSGQVAFHKIWSSVEWVNPDNCIFGVKSLEVFCLNLIRSICLHETVNDEVLSLVLIFVQELGWHKFFERVSNLVWANCRFDILNRFLGLFTLDVKSRVQWKQASFDCFLNSQVGNSHWALVYLVDGLEITAWFDLSNYLSALFRDKDTHWEEFSQINVLMWGLHYYFLFLISAWLFFDFLLPRINFFLNCLAWVRNWFFTVRKAAFLTRPSFNHYPRFQIL